MRADATSDCGKRLRIVDGARFLKQRAGGPVPYPCVFPFYPRYLLPHQEPELK